MTNNNDLIKKLKIGFMGTPSFAVPILNSLIKDNYRIVFVYTQSGRPAGRGLLSPAWNLRVGDSRNL